MYDLCGDGKVSDNAYHSGDVGVYRGCPRDGGCLGEVWPKHGRAPYQCKNRAKYFRRIVGRDSPIGFCGNHDPVLKSDRRKLIDARKLARANKKAKERDAYEKLLAMKGRALDAIRSIADGHPDPAGLAAQVLNGGVEP